MKSMVNAVLWMFFATKKDLRRTTELRLSSHVYELYRSNYNNGWLGRAHTLKTRDKIRSHMTSNESTNPRIWVCKDGIVKYVLKTRLQEFLELGFELGRVGYKPRKGKHGSIIEIKPNLPE